MKTKILATIGPASNKRDVLSKLIAAGVRIFRLNFSHGDSSSFVDLIKMIRELEIVHKTPITILQDLSGPKIRIGTFPNEGSLNVLKGDQLLLGPSSLMCNDEFPYMAFVATLTLSVSPVSSMRLASATLRKISGRAEESTMKYFGAFSMLFTSFVFAKKSYVRLM